jgi:nucleoside-diphosphate-sugar epimerase
VARALIVGCGCSGRELGVRLRERGWQVRGTSRTAAGCEAIENSGLEAAVADPERPGTVLELVADATAVAWLLGSARGERALLEAIHGPRLERLLEKLVDTAVRGFVYEAGGTVDRELLSGGAAAVTGAGRRWRIPVALLEGERDEAGWAERSADAVEALLRR